MMSEKLQNIDQMRNDFISNASHELKTPLSAMKILIESLLHQENPDPATTRDFLGDINQEIDRLSAIVGDLLTIVRFDSRSEKLQMEPIALDELDVRYPGGGSIPLRTARALRWSLPVTSSASSPVIPSASAGNL